MWLFTTIGFFSVVATTAQADAVVVRARARADLEALREHVLPDIDVVETPDRDYRWRAVVDHDDWAYAALHLASAIDYENFKREVARVHGADRAHRYGDVWSVMLGLQTDAP